MKKLDTHIDNEINIQDLIVILWKKKIVILLITLFSFLIGVFYNYNNQKSPYFEFSIEIKESSEEEFYKFLILTDILSEFKFPQNVFQNSINIYQFLIRKRSILSSFYTIYNLRCFTSSN